MTLHNLPTAVEAKKAPPLIFIVIALQILTLWGLAWWFAVTWLWENMP